MERPGVIASPASSPLVLGSYAQDHAAHFYGHLDEVRLYHRALSPEEIKQLSTDE
jgi:hypothetical protein